MRLDAFIISVLVFSLFIVVGFTIWYDVNSEYEINASTSDYEDVYNVTGELYDTARDMQGKTLDAEVEGTDQSWESLVKGTYSSVRLITGSFRVVGGMINAVARRIGVPEIFVQVAMTILLVSIVFSIIYLIFRFKG